MLDNYQFDKLDRSRDWKEIFDQIDSNFSKVADYFATLGNRVMIESFSAKANQSEFELSEEYNTLRNCLAVYKNGVRQWLNDSYYESSSKSFTMSVPCKEGDRIVAVYNKYYVVQDTAPLDAMILVSPNGSKFKVTVDDEGNLQSTRA